MRLENENYKVHITVDETYTVDSADNRAYDLILNPSNLTRSDITRTFCIKVETPHGTKTAAMIGGLYSYDTDCAVMNESILIVLQDHLLVQIDLSDFSVLGCKKLDNIGCNCGIYLCEKGYIIFGEISLTMLDFGLDKLWSFENYDVFTSISINNNAICLECLEGGYIEIDFDGNERKIK